jgi:RNA polymerase sigma-70 factor (ECF subfamily)
MSGQVETAGESRSSAEQVRRDLADPAVAARLRAIAKSAAGRCPPGVTRLQREAEVDEVFQEVMLRVHRAAETFDPGRGSLFHWWGGICWRVAMDRQKARGRVLDPSHVDGGYAVPRDADLEDDREECRELLGRLAPQDARLLRLYAEGYGAAEIGEQLGMKPGAVRVRHSRLIQELKAMRREADGEGRR